MLEEETVKLEDNLTAIIRITKENEEIDRKTEIEKIKQQAKKEVQQLEEVKNTKIIELEKELAILILILINIGQEENYITRELVTEDEIITTELLCPELPKALMYTEETTEKEIIIGGVPIVIKFKIYQGDENITLGIKWIEQAKPYNLEDKQLK